MRIFTAFSMMLFAFAFAGSLAAASLSYDELTPAAIVISDHHLDTWKHVRDIAERNGARGLMMFPPDVVYGRFEGTVDRSLYAGLPVAFAFSSDELAGAGLAPMLAHVVGQLFDYRQVLASAPPAAEEAPIEDVVLRVPPEIVRATTPAGPRRGSPHQLADRGISQNSEFLIGSVCLNIVFPESAGNEENWTDQQIQDALSALSLGLTQYQQRALWTDLSFTINSIKGVPVTMEPIDGNMNTDPIWIGEALRNIGYQGGSFGGTHALNNAMRQKYGTDWAYTSYVVNMTALDNSLSANCWGGAGYVAYSYLGGPYMVIPYPACRYGYGLGFGRVFIHEMSHGFWALDEYASAQTACNTKTGYLAVPTMNTLYMACIETVPCIMQTAPAPITTAPICEYTMGQVGLWDNGNSIPLIFNKAPSIEFLNTLPGTVDTLLPDWLAEYEIEMNVKNDAVPNLNPQQAPEERMDVAPYIRSCEVSIQGAPYLSLAASDGSWDDADEYVIYRPQLAPGLNNLHFLVKNRVYISTSVDKKIYVFGMKYYYVAAAADAKSIQLSFVTSGVTFGSVFDLLRTDATAGTGEKLIASIASLPDNPDQPRQSYSYADTNVIAGHDYHYRLLARFTVHFRGQDMPFQVSSGTIEETALIPLTGLISRIVPNPVSGANAIARFTVDIPETFRGVGDSPGTTASGRRSSLSTEIRTPIEVSVYNVLGVKIRTVFQDAVFGGFRLFQWDGTDSSGKRVPTGVYFVNVKAGSQKDTRKIILLR